MTSNDCGSEFLDENDFNSHRLRKNSLRNGSWNNDCRVSLQRPAQLPLKRSKPLKIFDRIDSIETAKDMNFTNTCTIPSFDHPDNVNLLFTAAKNQNVAGIKTLVRAGVNLGATDQYGHTVLHWAVLQDRSRVIQKQPLERNLDTMLEIVKTLLSNGSDVNAATNSGHTALHFAVNFGYTKVAAALLDHKADVHEPFGKYIKHAETEECFNVEDQVSFASSVKDVLRSGHRSWRNPPTTILHIAVRHMYVNIVIILLRKGAKVDATQDDGRTPLMLAGENSSYSSGVKIVESLLDYGANVNLVNTDGNTPLHYACQKNNRAVVKVLLVRGAKVNSFNSSGKTPLMIAVEEDCEKVVETLLENGADIDRRDNCGMTVLHIACDMARDKAVALLLKAGADVNITCDDGRVPYELALAMQRNCWGAKPNRFRNVCSKHFVSYVGHRPHLSDCEYTKSRDLLELLKRHLDMMMYLNVPLHPQNIIERTSVASNVSYSEQYVKTAVESFKSITLTATPNKITIQNILEDRRDPVYVLNECVMKELNKALCELNIGILESDMTNVLKFVTRKAEVKVKLLNIGQDWLTGVLSFSDNQLPLFPREVNRKILAYLNEEEIIRAMGTLCTQTNLELYN